MKTILKSGQKTDIYRPSGEMEGVATLIKLVRKCHTHTPPIETWIVKFDDDEEPVQRDIQVKISQISSISSSLARAPESRNLLTFMAVAGLSNDWADPSGHGVTAYTSGKVLNNEVGATELAGSHQINNELLLHLESAGAKIILNLNTILVLASSYIRQQYDIATEAVQKPSCALPNVPFHGDYSCKSVGDFIEPPDSPKV